MCVRVCMCKRQRERERESLMVKDACSGGYMVLEDDLVHGMEVMRRGPPRLAVRSSAASSVTAYSQDAWS
jgi:hypothetical protein